MKHFLSLVVFAVFMSG